MSKHFCKRLRPGSDLREGIYKLVAEHQLHAAYIGSAVGSLTHARLRLAGSDKFFDSVGPFEIVSATGTVGIDGIHVHIAISDSEGKTIGGHLVEGCIINTTAEIVLSAVDNVRFKRTMDPATGYPELDIST
jgi:predicted DNA-binding protein with PD1-like motif